MKDVKSWLSHWVRLGTGANHVGRFISSLCDKHWKLVTKIITVEEE